MCLATMKGTGGEGRQTMIHMTGAFAYQPYAIVRTRFGQPETQPAAIYIALMLRNDDGTAVFLQEDDVDVAASVILSQPQRLGEGTANDIQLVLTLDAISDGYLGFTAPMDLAGNGLPLDYIPLALRIWAQGSTIGVLTAAPYPIPDTGIAPLLSGRPSPGTGNL